jgi:hypothetical protein
MIGRWAVCVGSSEHGHWVIYLVYVIYIVVLSKRQTHGKSAKDNMLGHSQATIQWQLKE